MEFSTNYNDIEDKELVRMILEDGNQEAMLYIIYDRYLPLLKRLCRKYYDDLYYLEQLQTELFIHMKTNDWRTLRSFGWKSSFGTWLGMVAGHLFLKKMPELIGIDPYSISIGENGNDGEVNPPAPGDEHEFDDRMTLLCEAIQQLEDPDQRFILYREFEGYKPDEIAVQLTEHRRKEGRLKTRKTEDGQVVPIIPDAKYIHMLKGRAKTNIRTIINKIKINSNGSK